jgi:outer membrane protein assembly factor BamB
MWTTEPNSHAIVGGPVPIGDGYLVADESGQYVMIDALTGRPRGQSLQVRGSLGPAATPVVYSNDRIFAPLTDGTIMLLRLEGAQQAKR